MEKRQHQWFAAVHLGRMLLDQPEPELKRRRDEALKNHATAKAAPPPQPREKQPLP